MIIDYILMFFLSLEIFLPIILGQIIPLKQDSSSWENYVETKNSTFQAGGKRTALPKESSALIKIFIIITDLWFFRWLKKEQLKNLTIKQKTEKTKVLVRNDLSQAHVSYYTNNTKYAGQSQKKYLC